MMLDGRLTFLQDEFSFDEAPPKLQRSIFERLKNAASGDDWIVSKNPFALSPF